MTDPNRAALEAQIALLESQLTDEERAHAIPTTAAPTAYIPAVSVTPPPSAPAPVSPSPTSALAPVASRQTPIVAARPSPMFMKSATLQAQMSRTPGVLTRARPAPVAAAPAVAPVAAAPAVAPSAPLAHRQRPIVRPTASPKQLPRVTIPGMPRPAQAKAAVGSAYMRAKPRT